MLNCDFKQEMSTLKKELIKEIRAAQSKNRRLIQRFYYDNY